MVIVTSRVHDFWVEVLQLSLAVSLQKPVENFLFVCPVFGLEVFSCVRFPRGKSFHLLMAHQSDFQLIFSEHVP